MSVDDVLNYPVCCSLANQICCPGGVEVMQEQVDCACEDIMILLGQDYCPKEECRYFDGSGHCKLFLGCDIQEIDSIEFISCEDTCECKDPCKDEEMPCISGSVLEYRCQGEFPCGTKNIKICGTWGTKMPAKVKKAIVWLSMEYITPGIMGLDQCPNATTITWDDFSISRQVREGVDNTGYSTGYPSIDDMIRPYINPESQLFMGTTSNCDCHKSNCKSCN